jgi:acyl carrier protein
MTTDAMSVDDVAMSYEGVRRDVRDFIVDNFLFGDRVQAPDDQHQLVGTGVIDSTGILELIEFLESHFTIDIADDETIPANLGSVGAIATFVLSKLSAGG